MSRILLFLILIIFPLTGFSQNKAVNNILDQFKHSGLLPKGENNTYSQIMVHKKGKDFHKGTFLVLNGDTLKTGKDFVPLIYSANSSAAGNPLIAVQERKMPWIINLDNYPLQSSSEPSSALYKIAQQALKDQATAVLFYDNQENRFNPAFDPKITLTPLSIPVVFVRNAASKNYFKDQTASATVQLEVNIYETTDTAYNFLGYLDNSAPFTILISTFYDHKDDMATLFELAKRLKNDKHYRKANYLFIACSPNEKSLNYFAENPTLDLNKTAYLINLNKTGQLNSDNDTLYISGYESSPKWAQVLHKVKSKSLTLQFEPGRISSPNLSVFYEKNIPLLSLSTEKNSFSPDTISEVTNDEGKQKILEYFLDIIERLNRDLK